MEYRKIPYNEYFEIELIKSAIIPQVKVKDLRSQASRTSAIIGINMISFSRLILLPEILIRRYFQLHVPTLSLSYIGLRGGGNTSSSKVSKARSTQRKNTRRMTIINTISSSLRQSYEEIAAEENVEQLKKNLYKAVRIATQISEFIASSRVDMPLIMKLAKISPYTCSNPQEISKILLDNFNSNLFWALYLDRDKRSLIATIIRRFLMAGIIKDPRRTLFGDSQADIYLKMLDIVNNRLSINSDDPELWLEIEVKVIIRLLSRPIDIIHWWTNVVNECPGIMQAVIGRKYVGIGPLVTIFNHCNKVDRVLNDSYAELISDIEVLEQTIQISNTDCIDHLQGYLKKLYAEISKMKWEQVHILLKYTVDSIKNGKLEFIFIPQECFDTLMNHKNWKIREGCAESLRTLRGNSNAEIKLWAEMLTTQMIKKENKSSYKNQGVRKLLMLAPAEVLNAESREVISNVYERETIVGRDNEICVIAYMLHQDNIITLIGKVGIGKTSIAIKYSQIYKNKYSITHQIDCGTDKSMKSGMRILAYTLGLENDIEESLFSELRRELNEYQDSMLIILDNITNYDDINCIYVKNPKVHFLATSRLQENQTTMVIWPLSIADSKKILQEKIISFGEREEFGELAGILEGWPLALVESTKIIFQNNYTIREFIKPSKNLLINVTKIKEALEFTFSNLSSPTQYILEVLRLCGPEKIPESIIKAVFLAKEYSDSLWLDSKTSLINSYIIEDKGGYWKINKIIRKYIKKNYNLRPEEVSTLLVDYYYENFSVTNGILLDRKRIKKIKHLSSHVNMLLHRQGVQNAKQFMLLFNLIYLYIKIEIDPSLAEQYLSQIERFIIADNFEKKDLPEIYMRLGMLYLSNSQIENSQDCYSKALQILEDILPKDHQEFADIYSDLGLLKYLEGKSDESEDYYMQSLNILSSIECSDKPSKLANIYVGIGNLKRDNKEYTEGESYYRQALYLLKNILIQNHPEFADIYTNLGTLYMRKRNFKDAEKYYKKALKIMEPILPEENTDLEELHILLDLVCNPPEDLEEFVIESYMKKKFTNSLHLFSRRSIKPNNII